MHTRFLITMGDVAGIGPEIIARAWPKLVELGLPIVVGDENWLNQALRLIDSAARAQLISEPDDAQPQPDRIPILRSPAPDLSTVQVGRVSAAAGQAAYVYLCHSIQLALRGEVDAIVTCPLHKEGLHAAGIRHPGHTEILAEQTGAKSHAMLLFSELDEPVSRPIAVAHVTLHIALRDVFARLSVQSITEKVELLARLLPRLLGRPGRIAVAALNPHASDGGLFGNEEEMIAAAVRACQQVGYPVSGPIPADAVFMQANAGHFEGVVAMYHDQGHIALKLLRGRNLVNITAGLPIVRTSVAHGTAYDIAGKGLADASSLVTAARVAVRLARSRAS